MATSGMKKTGIVAAVVVAVLAVAALVAPSFVDWNRYKGDITGRIEEALGRRVTIGGDLSLALLPVPALSAKSVSLANIEGASSPDMVTLDSLRVRLDPLPLLTGKVKVGSIILEQPVIRLEKLSDGRSNWDFQKPDQPGGQAAADSPATGPGQDDAADAALDSLIIENGTLVYRGPDGVETTVEAVNAHVSAESLDGPFKAKGNFGWQAALVRFDASVGRLAEDRGSPVSARIDLPDADAELRLTGLLSHLSDGLSMRGRVVVAGSSVREVAKAAGYATALPPALAAAFGIDATIAASPTAVEVSDLNLRLGETRGSGGVNIRYDTDVQGDVRLAFNRIDVDQWLLPPSLRKETRRAAPAPSTVSEPAVATGPVGPAAVADGDAARGFALPAGLALNLDLSAEAVIYKGAAARQAKINVALADGEAVINEATALLPGGSQASVFGVIGARDGEPVFDGKVEAASDNVRSVLEWLEIDVAAVPADRLRKFQATANVRATPQEIEASEIDARLDTSRLRGALIARPGERLGLGVNVAIDSLNIDAYRPRATANGAAAAPSDGEKAQPSSPPPAADPLAALDTLDANIKARIDQITVNDSVVQVATLDASLVRGQLTIRAAEIGDFAGVAGRVAGTVANFAKPQLTDVTYDLRSRQPGKVLKLLGVDLPVDPEKLGTVAMSGSLDGDMDALSLETRTEAAGAVMGLSGRITSLRDAPKFDLMLEASHSSLLQLVRMFNEGYRPAAALGGFAFSTRVTGDPKAIAFADLRTRLGAVNLAGEAKVTLSGRPSVSATLNASEILVDPFLPAKRTAFRPLGDWLGAVPSMLPVAYRPGAPPRPTRALPVAITGERWSRDPLDLSALAAFDANIQLSAPALLYDTYRLDDPQVSVVVANGAAAIERLAGKLFGGDFQFQGRLAGGTVPAATGLLKITNANVREARLGAAGLEVIQGILDADSEMKATGRSTAEMIGQLTGAGRIGVRNGAISGFDLNAVNQRLNNIDNLGSLLGLVQSGMSGGTTRFSTLNGTFQADGGVVTTRDLALQAEGGTAQGVATVNLPKYTIDSDFKFRLGDQPNSPPLGMRLQGPLDNPRRFFDVNELQNHLLSRGVGRYLKGKGGDGVGGLVEGLLGRQQQPTPQEAPPQTAPQPQQPPQKPEEVIRDLLKGLGR